MNIKAYNVDSVPNNKNYSTNYKMDNLGLKKNVNLNSSKIKQTEFDTHNYENKLELPIIVINDKEVKINENNIDNRYIYKNNYRYLLKSIDSKNKKLVELINSKEIKKFCNIFRP